MDILEIRKQVDLHFGRDMRNEIVNYVKFSFHACYYELFNIPNSYWETDCTGEEIADILALLNIRFDRNYIIECCLNQQHHDVEVLHSADDEMVFAYFDLQKGADDQNDMFYLGIVCRKDQEQEVINRLLAIYRKLKTSSPFTYEIHSHSLYYKVFLSYSYFYNGKYPEVERRMRHYW